MKITERAFTRTDLLFCGCGLALLMTMALSVWGSNQSESRHALCANNLRQIGRAFHLWGSDHDELLPWRIVSDTGGQGSGGPNLALNAWWHYSVISNQLGSPKILACPADEKKVVANNWSTAPGGFLNVGARNNALSYPLFLHANSMSPSSLLAGDRNFRVDQANTSCSYLSTPAAFAILRGGVGTWTNALHGTIGHLLTMDGNVRFTTPAEFQQAIAAPGQDDNGTAAHGLQTP
jgi:hypothetical protein